MHARDDGESLMWELERHIARTDREDRAPELDLCELRGLADLDGL